MAVFLEGEGGARFVVRIARRYHQTRAPGPVMMKLHRLFGENEADTGPVCCCHAISSVVHLEDQDRAFLDQFRHDSPQRVGDMPGLPISIPSGLVPRRAFSRHAADRAPLRVDAPLIELTLLPAAAAPARVRYER